MQTAIWTRELVKMGYEVTISSFWGLTGSITEWNGIPVLPGFGAGYCSPSLQQHAKHLRPDLVMTLGDVWVLDPNVLRPLPVAHWLPADCRPMSTADRQVVEGGQGHLIAMSRFGQERFADAGYESLYVPHGIDMSLWTLPEDRDSLREDRGLGDCFVVGINAANNDAIRKAIPEMMLAFAKFHKTHPDARLAIHSGVHQDGGQDLELLAENLGITDLTLVVDQYRYQAGLIHEEDIRDWYYMIDVLCETTFGEGFGLPIVEAKACGTPVITTKCSAMEELNSDGIQVDGEPFWNGVHRAWWIRPSITQIIGAFEEAYERRNDVNPAKLRESAMPYDKDVVAEKHMRPAVEKLLEMVGR